MVRPIFFVHAQKAIPVATAALLGIFLAVSAHAFDWSSTSTLAVGGAFAVVLGLFGTPLLLMGSRSAVTAHVPRERLASSTIWSQALEESVEHQVLALALRDFYSRNLRLTESHDTSFTDFYNARSTREFGPPGSNTFVATFPSREMAVSRDLSESQLGEIKSLPTNKSSLKTLVQVPSRGPASMRIADFELHRHTNQVELDPFDTKLALETQTA